MLKQLMEDFFLSKHWDGGYGLLRDFPTAAAYSRQVTDRQRRRYRKYGRVPRFFIEFLKTIGVDFCKKKLGGIKLNELERILTNSEGNEPMCNIKNVRLLSLLKHLQQVAIVEWNESLGQSTRLVSSYKIT